MSTEQRDVECHGKSPPESHSPSMQLHLTASGLREDIKNIQGDISGA